MRRWERRLRSWWRHKQQTVRMALAAATHHNAQQNAAPRPKTGARAREVEEQVTHADLRAQKTPPRAWPGILAEPGPQRRDCSRRHFSGDCLPTLGLPVLPGALGEQVGSSAVRFLTASALESKRKLEEEEKEAKRRREQTAEEAARLELRSLLAVPRSRRTAEHESRLNAVTQLHAAASTRKRKKRKKTTSSSYFLFLTRCSHSETSTFFYELLVYLAVSCVWLHAHASVLVAYR